MDKKAAPKPPSTEPRTYPCPHEDCNTSYPRLSNLKQHLAAVHGEYADDDPNASSTDKKHLFRKSNSILGDELVRDSIKANNIKLDIAALEIKILELGVLTQSEICSLHKVASCHNMFTSTTKPAVLHLSKDELMNQMIAVRGEMEEPGLQGDLDMFSSFLNPEGDA